MMNMPIALYLLMVSFYISASQNIVLSNRPNKEHNACLNSSYYELEIKLFLEQEKHKLAIIRELLSNKNKVKRSIRKMEPICPGKVQMRISELSYPFSFLQVNCQKSPFVSEDLCRCVPIYHEFVFLEKGRCLEDNTYEWTPRLRNVSVACGCTRIEF